jgi:glycosyltransferase involved in cell wall biosynthesis
MTRLTVLHLIDSFHQGGTERQAVQLMRLLHETGRYNVRVACLNGDGVLRREVERLNPGPIEEFRLVSFHHPSTAAQLRRFVALLKSLRVDLLHAHDFYTNIFGMAGGLLARVPARIASRRETDPGRSKAQRFVDRRAFDAAHAVVVNADAIRRDLTRHGVRDAKIHTVYNGVDMSRLAAPVSSSRRDTLASFGIPAGEHAPRLLITILANLRLAIKDHPTFLRAAARVQAAVPDAGFIVAGEGELVDPMRQLARDLGIEDRVFFTGACLRVPELLSISDVCVLSSLSEGFPNVIVEYMASGRPIVSTDVGGAAEAIVDGRTGYLVQRGDAARMAERIVDLLRDEPMRTAMGTLGRATALEKFSCESQLQRTEAIYQRLLSRGQAAAGEHRPTERQPAAAAATDEAGDIGRRPAAYRPS